jgi:hypothetical protein
MNRRSLLTTAALALPALLPRTANAMSPMPELDDLIPVRIRCTGSSFDIARCEPEVATDWIQRTPSMNKMLAMKLDVWPVKIQQDPDGTVVRACIHCGARADVTVQACVQHFDGCLTPDAQT